jgi:hypothetical protein
MQARRKALALAGAFAAMLSTLLLAPAPLLAQGPPWQPPPRDDSYRPPSRDDAYRPPPRPLPPDTYYPSRPPPGTPYYPPGTDPRGAPGQPYDGPPDAYYDGPTRPYSSNEIIDAGHHFFGATTKGLAAVVEFAFQEQGRPNGYILGQDAGGAFIAGLRYGEGMLYTKDAGSHRVYWQGPSVGWDWGGDGSKVMVLVYNLRDPSDIYQRFGGVDGSAYFVGGVGLTFLKNGDIVTAPIRTGVGLRLGANVGYLKYTPQPTWFPF